MAEQISLDLSSNVMKAVDQAFEEAQNYLTSGMGLAPFTVTVVDEGLEINDHSAETSEDVYDSVRMLLADDMPEGYALCYDGYVDTDDGKKDAIIVEAADRGSVMAYALALMYTLENGQYTFEGSYGYAGPMDQLYPAGTRPIKSGMEALSDEDRQAIETERAEGEDGEVGEQGAVDAPTTDEGEGLGDTAQSEQTNNDINTGTDTSEETDESSTR